MARHPADWRISFNHYFPLPRSVFRRSSNSIEMPGLIAGLLQIWHSHYQCQHTHADGFATIGP
ncbi:MAG: hypothetical protein WB580_10080, partial [Candidatus Binataceae bacterium]